MDKKNIINYVEWTQTREPHWGEMTYVTFSEPNSIRNAREIRAFQILHGVLGLASELPELRRASSAVNLVEEYGDCFWYLASIVRGLSLTDVWAEQVKVMEEASAVGAEYHLYRNLEENTGVMLDQVKRHIFYSANNQEFLGTLLALTTDSLIRLVKSAGLTIENVLATNKAKLEARYKDRHTKEEALNRDLTVEESVMKSEIERAITTIEEQRKYKELLPQS